MKTELVLWKVEIDRLRARNIQVIAELGRNRQKIKGLERDIVQRKRENSIRLAVKLKPMSTWLKSGVV